MAILIRTDGSLDNVFPINGTDFTLEELYEHLNCTCIDIIRLLDNSDNILVIDDEGKLKKDFVVNKLATVMARTGRIHPKDYDPEKDELAKQFDFTVHLLGTGDNELDFSVVGNAILCDKSQIK